MIGVTQRHHRLRARAEDRTVPNSPRISRRRAGDVVLGYTRATEVADPIETLLARPESQRMRNLRLFVSTNNGKSVIIEKFRRSHPPTALQLVNRPLRTCFRQLGDGVPAGVRQEFR
ncbi:TniB family NTP-binding protein [Nonomuraea turcica]|uniref:TniB family NTP-binding protein n=1 Tax=Nonomuraea sp. G32 TaxID=3067274 RepID=UPI00352FF68F